MRPKRGPITALTEGIPAIKAITGPSIRRTAVSWQQERLKALQDS